MVARARQSAQTGACACWPVADYRLALYTLLHASRTRCPRANSAFELRVSGSCCCPAAHRHLELACGRPQRLWRARSWCQMAAAVAAAVAARCLGRGAQRVAQTTRQSRRTRGRAAVTAGRWAAGTRAPAEARPLRSKRPAGGAAPARGRGRARGAAPRRKHRLRGDRASATRRARGARGRAVEPRQAAGLHIPRMRRTLCVQAGMRLARASGGFRGLPGAPGASGGLRGLPGASDRHGACGARRCTHPRTASAACRAGAARRNRLHTTRGVDSCARRSAASGRA